MNDFFPAAATLAAYLIGSLSFAVIVSRLMRLDDPRTYGSKNPGATNVLRSGSKVAAVLTLVLDALKGLIPVLLVQQLGERVGLGAGTVALVGLAAFVGHLWPVFFKFAGGKGVATAIGVVFGFEPLLGLACVASWGLITYFFRYVSLASMAAAVFAPVYYVFGHQVAWTLERPLLGALVTMMILLIWRHRENIERLVKGTESRLGQKPAAASATATATPVEHKPTAKPGATKK
jgi:acyl phosphate:glycerol-3-phosphate acyltransferase